MGKWWVGAGDWVGGVGVGERRGSKKRGREGRGQVREERKGTGKRADCGPSPVMASSLPFPRNAWRVDHTESCAQTPNSLFLDWVPGPPSEGAHGY